MATIAAELATITATRSLGGAGMLRPSHASGIGVIALQG